MAEPTMGQLLLQAAQRDAVAFHKLVNDTEVHDSIIGFHAQQAIKKALKAVLFQHAVQVPRTQASARRPASRICSTGGTNSAALSAGCRHGTEHSGVAACGGA